MKYSVGKKISNIFTDLELEDLIVMDKRIDDIDSLIKLLSSDNDNIEVYAYNDYVFAKRDKFIWLVLYEDMIINVLNTYNKNTSEIKSEVLNIFSTNEKKLNRSSETKEIIKENYTINGYDIVKTKENKIIIYKNSQTVGFIDIEIQSIEEVIKNINMVLNE